MKTFSDLLDTNPRLAVRIQLRPVIDNGAPVVSVRVNEHSMKYLAIDTPADVTYYVNLLEPLIIEISLTGKEYSAERETAVVVESLKIDDFEVVPNYIRHVEYSNDQNFTNPTNYLGFNGTWRLTIDRPFYQWQHQVTGQGWLLEP